MKKLLAALLVLVATASAGIEVLGIEVLQNGNVEVEVQATQPPAGSAAEYVRIVDGKEVVLDVAPVDTVTGRAYLEVPATAPGDFIRIVDPNGTTVSEVDVD